jgi:hypothetical protein
VPSGHQVGSRRRTRRRTRRRRCRRQCQEWRRRRRRSKRVRNLAWPLRWIGVCVPATSRRWLPCSSRTPCTPHHAPNCRYRLRRPWCSRRFLASHRRSRLMQQPQRWKLLRGWSSWQRRTSSRTPKVRNPTEQETQSRHGQFAFAHVGPRKADVAPENGVSSVRPDRAATRRQRPVRRRRRNCRGRTLPSRTSVTPAPPGSGQMSACVSRSA